MATSVLTEFDESTRWYATHAWQARSWHYSVGLLLIVTGASISVVALAFPSQSVLVAALGATVAVFTGVRALFHWDENWYRFTGACQALKQERRKYIVRQAPYDNPATRHRELMNALNRIESTETQGWLDLKQDAGDKTPPNTPGEV